MTATGQGYMLCVPDHAPPDPRGRHTDLEGGSMPKHVPKMSGVEPGPYPFSQVVEANGFVFLAGQVGDAPGTHSAVPGGIEPQTRAMLDNVGRLLKTVGLDYNDVVRCTVYLRDFGDFAAMNAVYREYFPTDPPARATVGVTALAADYAIEIEVTAAR
jgi:2-iminobutanoate/2-iminopropanoate deaminase